MSTKKRKRTINARLVVSELIKEERTLWNDYSVTLNNEDSSKDDIDMTKWKWWAVRNLLRRLNIDENTLTSNYDVTPKITINE